MSQLAEQTRGALPSPTRRAGSLTPARLAAITALTLVCFAANSLLCRAALAGGLIDPASFTGVRLASGAVALAMIAAARKRPLTGGSWASSLALVAYAAAFSFAYRRVQAGPGSFLLFGAVQISMIGWSAAQGARPTLWQRFGVALALGGLAYLVAPGWARLDPVGSLLMLCAGAAWGCYSLRGRTSEDPLATNAGNFLRAVPVALALLAVPRSISASPAGMALAVASGAVASGVGYSLWYGVIPDLGATRAAAVQLVVPVLAGVSAVVLLGEPLTGRLAAAGAAIIVGVAIATNPHNRRS